MSLQQKKELIQFALNNSFLIMSCFLSCFYVAQIGYWVGKGLSVKSAFKAIFFGLESTRG